MQFGTRLRILRKERQLTQEDFSKIIHVGYKTVSDYERGISQPDIETISMMADFFGVTTDYLLGNTDDPKATVVAKIDRTGFSLFQVEIMDELKELDKNDLDKVFDYIQLLKASKILAKEAAKSEK